MVEYTVQRTFINVEVSPTSSEEGDELSFCHALTDGAVLTRSRTQVPEPQAKHSLSDDETGSENEMLPERTETSAGSASEFLGEMTPWQHCDYAFHGLLHDGAEAGEAEGCSPRPRREEPAPQAQQQEGAPQPAERAESRFVQMLMPVNVQAVPLQLHVLPFASLLPPTPVAQTAPSTPLRQVAASIEASISGGRSSGSGVKVPEKPKAWRTTIMLRNLPNNYRRQTVLQMLDDQGFAGLYDFLYLPMDFKTQACFGYCFVNLINPEVALRCWSTFEGFSKWVVPSRKKCYVSWSGPHQGLEDHVDWYRGSAIMHSSVPDDYKPILFRDGLRIPFPAPKKVTRAPKARAAPTQSGRRGSH